MINEATIDISAAERRLWEHISILPEKWKQEPYGTQGGGFWIVGLIGRNVIWYNDIEDGFNLSRYTTYGEIGEYWCNQDSLLTVLTGLNRMIVGDA
ncbi:hypothetical protein FJ987_06415 [Mesorhizobium sp. CU2]|nr:hypothetical protein FJ988_06660 [Mesorhizobium sp. CU3]TPO19933.1 hypothetical protein FJ987_06415 [Mesorhizobium sp. CU2]